MPGPDPDPTRPEPREDEPTAVTPPADDDGVSGLKPTKKEPPRWSGSAAVPPPPEKKRKRWLATVHDLEAPGLAPSPPPRDPTMQLPDEERRAYESGAPVDPWADADPLDQPYPQTLLDVPHAPPPALPPAPPPPPPALPPPPARRPAAAPPPPPPPPANLPARQALPDVRKPPKKQKSRKGPPPPPPQAPPPGWRPPQGYVPVPVRRRRRKWPWVFLFLTLACCCGCPAYFGKPMWEQYPASASLPAEVSDLSLRDDAASRRVVTQMETDLRGSHVLAEDTFAGVYSDGAGKRVTLFGTTGFRFSPESDLEKEINRLSSRYALRQVESIDTGTRGEYLRCGVGKDGQAAVAVCGWADHGSLATGVFTRRSVDDSAALLERLRGTIVSRG
ncbi:hypothetical protein RB614_00035 [Phytohabitans sp. ZYX-F-186]|uniref:Uncharacterized protein n=1 Tax=Phytohabitans maris TaxID=3071409 RepID=A0ABU0Z772_9ACTN|nr:hypothetical protein [Phytohabitans sp. ZYX-F-186]MDQ7902908.1 hypothetical protein [Phytohabitans sp. ZYX-F-186]